jgi:hypothetical protein
MGSTAFRTFIRQCDCSPEIVPLVSQYPPAVSRVSRAQFLACPASKCSFLPGCRLALLATFSTSRRSVIMGSHVVL